MNERDGLFLNHILSAVADIEVSVPWRQIAGTRDRLIHAYFSVDLDAVWSMIEQDLPSLRTNVRQILEQARMAKD